MAVETTEQVENKEQINLLNGTEEKETETPQATEKESAGDDGEEEIQEQETRESTPEIDLKTVASTIQETLQDKVEQIQQIREENTFLSKQVVVPDASQFEKGGLYEDLPQWFLGQTLIYQASEYQVNQAISQIENDPGLSESEKRQRLRTIDKALAVYEDRKNQYSKQIAQNLDNTNVQEWQAVELGFKDSKTGIKGIEKYIPEIWEWCKAEMASSRVTKAKCEASFDEKFKLAVKAIRALGIDKKLGKDLSGEDRPGISVPVGQAGNRGTKRGAESAPTFTRKQLAELTKNPAKVDEKLMEQINKAMAEGRIRDK